jgi:RNA polymerase sigma-70 factor (ECF subfamily)
VDTTGEPENPEESDYDLAQRTARGDVSAFEELFRRHNRRVFSLCLRMTGNVADAEDLTQEIFVHLHRKVGGFRGESAFTTWLHRLTVNHVLMHFRKEGLRLEQASGNEIPDQAALGTENPYKLPMVDNIALSRAISQLAPGYRIVFVLHDIEGYLHEEIAEMLGFTIHTSKSQLRKARLKLRQSIYRRNG